MNQDTTKAESHGPLPPYWEAGNRLSLDLLARRRFGELEPLYGDARCPSSMGAIEGTPKGRMLAIRGLDATPLAGPIHGFARSKGFVWDGKTFESKNLHEGTGVNRVVIPVALGRQNLFPFHTHFGASLVDGRRALILNYDLSENPPWIRRIHDEVREVSPGLFLGPAMWRGRSGATTVLWFGLQVDRGT